jgi:hypothetical protein
LRAEGFFCNLDVLYGRLGIGKIVVFDPYEIRFFFSCKFFSNFWSSKPMDPDWIRIGIQPKMLDPDPFQINTDPQELTEVPVMTEDSDAGYTQVLISFGHELLASADATAGAADARHGTAALHFITLHAPCWALLITVQPVAKRYIDTAAAGVSAEVLA